MGSWPDLTPLFHLKTKITLFVMMSVICRNHLFIETVFICGSRSLLHPPKTKQQQQAGGKSEVLAHHLPWSSLPGGRNKGSACNSQSSDSSENKTALFSTAYKRSYQKHSPNEILSEGSNTQRMREGEQKGALWTTPARRQPGRSLPIAPGYSVCPKDPGSRAPVISLLLRGFENQRVSSKLIHSWKSWLKWVFQTISIFLGWKGQISTGYAKGKQRQPSK